MKKGIVFFCFILLVSGCHSKRTPDAIRIMTFNVRVNLESDNANAWPFRKDMAAGMIRFHGVDILGTQEALDSQIQDLAQRLPDHGWVGVGRDDGLRNGELAAVFFLRDRWTGKTFYVFNTHS